MRPAWALRAVWQLPWPLLLRFQEQPLPSDDSQRHLQTLPDIPQGEGAAGVWWGRGGEPVQKPEESPSWASEPEPPSTQPLPCRLLVLEKQRGNPSAGPEGKQPQAQPHPAREGRLGANYSRRVVRGLLREEEVAL